MKGELVDDVVEDVLGGGGEVSLHRLQPAGIVVRVRHHDHPEQQFPNSHTSLDIILQKHLLNCGSGSVCF